MLDKDPGLFNQILNLLGPEFGAAVMAMIISMLRILYDREETKWQRIGLESLLCGVLSCGIASGLRYFELDTGLAVFVGSLIGFLGVEFVRGQAKKFVKRANKDDANAE